MPEILTEVMRGSLVESIHRGDLAIVDFGGKLLYSVGDPREKTTFIRSASKPIQAIPIVTSGAADHFNFTEKELAIFCASHNSEPFHIETIMGILEKIGCREDDLQCGSHLPFDKPSANHLIREGQEPTAAYSNCSGKHSGMLALAKYHGWDIKNYLSLEHPVQQSMLSSMALFSGLNEEDIQIGVDGCGVPVFGLPVYNMAWAWARLARPADLDAKHAEAASRLTAAMTAAPAQVAGTGRLCTALMTHLNGRLVAKSGAEAVYCAGMLQEGIGIAVKIEDGNGRATGPSIIEALRQMDFLSENDLENLKSFHNPTLYNHRKDVVGEIRAAFTLEK